MTLVLILDVVVCLWLLSTAVGRGLEAALPRAALVLLLLPAESQVKIPGLFDLTTHRVVILLLVLLWFAQRRQSSATGSRRPIPLRGQMGLVTLWMLLSAANSVVPWISLKTAISQCLDFFLVFMVYTTAITCVETIEKILRACVAAMLLCSVCGALEAYAGWSVLSVFPVVPLRFADLQGVATDRGLRVQATFGHAILFGATLSMCIPLALHLLAKATSGAQRLFLWTALLLMALCLYKTGSRGPWLALLLALGTLLIVGRGRIRAYIAALAVLSVVVLLLRPGVTESLVNIYAATRDPTSPEGQSYQWRYMLYEVASRELGKSTGRALWGYGPESFYFLNLTAPFLMDGEVHTVKVLSCDSAVVELMVDTGYVGFALIALLLGRAGFTGVRAMKRLHGEHRSLLLALLLAFGVFCFMMTNVEIYGWGQQNYLLWIVVACILFLAKMPAPVVEAPSPAADEATLRWWAGAEALRESSSRCAWNKPAATPSSQQAAAGAPVMGGSSPAGHG